VAKPFELALKEQKVELPQTKYFLNFSINDARFKMPWTRKKELIELISREFKRIGGQKFRNVAVVDEYACSGRTLASLSDAIKRATGKETITIALGRDYKPIYYPDYFSNNYRVWDLTEDLISKRKPVKDAEPQKPGLFRLIWNRLRGKKSERPIVSRVTRDREGARAYAEYLKGINKEFKK
jgi:hypothetical protein